MTVLAARVLAGLVAVGILLFAAWAVLVTALIGGLSARAPNPCVPDVIVIVPQLDEGVTDRDCAVDATDAKR
jgi:hypothetical protein